MVSSRPGMSRDEVFAQLTAMSDGDVRWRDGRAYSLAYSAGDDVRAVAEEAARRFAGDNALNTDAFPSLRRMQAEVVDIAGGWLGADGGCAGFMTSGGTESILLAVKAAREWGKRERSIAAPNVVMPASAHAAFEKACYYFGLESRRVPVAPDWTADVAAMDRAVDGNTVLVVGSAPQYPQGVIDPIAEIAALAQGHGVLCHVDACMGGVTLPYLAELGEAVPPWNFGVDGVTSMSVDLHKFGYTAKGASVVMYRNKQLRALQTFVTNNWLGGLYGSSGILGTKSGGPIAAAWAVMQHLGDDGYRRLTATARRATLELAAAVGALPGIHLVAPPATMLLSITADDPAALDVFAVADRLWHRGWYVDRQGPPPSLHLTVNAVHDGLIPAFVAELRTALGAGQAGAAPGDQGAYGTVE